MQRLVQIRARTQRPERPGAEAYLPVSLDDARRRGWDRFDIVLVNGDAHVDHPTFGVPLIGRLLASRGFRVGIVSQPRWDEASGLADFAACGWPRLFFGVSSGNMDSMVNHYTAGRKRRSSDAYTPDAAPGKRPDYAAAVYTRKLKKLFPDVAVVLGGVEASLRRLAHYDYWSDRVRHSILVDCPADLVVYGMAERPILEVAARLAAGEDICGLTDVRGTAVRFRDDPEQAWRHLAGARDRGPEECARMDRRRQRHRRGDREHVAHGLYRRGLASAVPARFLRLPHRVREIRHRPRPAHPADAQSASPSRREARVRRERSALRRRLRRFEER